MRCRRRSASTRRLSWPSASATSNRASSSTASWMPSIRPMSTPVADLHLHTTFSDGIDVPERVVELAHQAGLSTIAITDHDNTDAMALAGPAAQRLGLELIPGIEMSASARGNEVHVLGYLFDAAHPALREHLTVQQARRVRRVPQRGGQLRGVGGGGRGGG